MSVSRAAAVLPILLFQLTWIFYTHSHGMGSGASVTGSDVTSCEFREEGNRVQEGYETIHPGTHM